MNFISAAETANDVVRFLNERYGMHMDAASTAADKRRIYLEMLEKEGMQPIRKWWSSCIPWETPPRR